MLAVRWPSAIQPQTHKNLPCAIGARSPAKNGYTNTWVFWMIGFKMHEEAGRISANTVSGKYFLCINQKLLKKTSLCDWKKFITDWCMLGGLPVSVPCLLTYISPPWLDDNGTPTTSLLLNLGHAFPGLLVGVVCGTYCNLVLDPTQTIQLNAPFTAKTKKRQWERETGIDRKKNNIVSEF